jgi:hypothetical protein
MRKLLESSGIVTSQNLIIDLVRANLQRYRDAKPRVLKKIAGLPLDVEVRLFVFILS